MRYMYTKNNIMSMIFICHVNYASSSKLIKYESSTNKLPTFLYIVDKSIQRKYSNLVKTDRQKTVLLLSFDISPR